MIVITTQISLLIFHLWCGNISLLSYNRSEIFPKWSGINRSEIFPKYRVEIIGAKYFHSRDKSFRPRHGRPGKAECFLKPKKPLLYVTLLNLCGFYRCNSFMVYLSTFHLVYCIVHQSKPTHTIETIY